MITPEEFVRRWRWSELVRPRPELIEPIVMPDASKRFLVSTGLPSRGEGDEELQFEHLRSGVARLSEIEDGTAGVRDLSAYWRIGSCLSSYVCVSEGVGGDLVVVHDLRESDQFLNSSVPQLAESLLMSAELVDLFARGERNFEKRRDRRFAADWLRKEIKRIDGRALEDSGSVWSIVIFEITDY